MNETSRNYLVPWLPGIGVYFVQSGQVVSDRSPRIGLLQNGAHK
jgi:hypothetical protein